MSPSLLVESSWRLPWFDHAPTAAGLAIAFALALVAATLRASLGAYSRSWLFDYTPDAKARERLERWLAREDRHEATLTLIQIAAEVFFVLALPGLLPDRLRGVELGPPGDPRRLGAALVAAVVLLVPLVHSLPRTLAGGGRAETILRAALGVLNLLSLLLFPVIEPLVLLRGRARELLDRRPEQHKELLTRDIVDAVAEGQSGGALKAQSAEMIGQVLALEERVVSEVMTPRTDLTAVAIEATLDEAVALAQRESHSKIPVFERTRDQIKGIFHVRDALAHFGDGRHREVTVGEVMRPALFVPETKRVAQLLRELQAARQSVAVVLDEYGGTAGIITVEDIVEEIVGDLSEQHDREPGIPFLRLGGPLISFDPRLRVAEFNEKSGAALPESDEYDTVGGFVLKHLDRIPEPGEIFTAGGLEFRVTRVEGRRIARLHCRTLAPQKPAST